ncbi:hypothetical protein RF11_04000 [Thelohanellus kitauei]|uniref:Tc1-like transposase DDE domain-containing protein n=1 Tax=Thelohanellus kitauei TaxID=669202 RepID=A0A0C2IV95_THEKT|nr:hypothetical protein RF11_04000 [Thelohanellus kitauei]
MKFLSSSPKVFDIDNVRFHHSTNVREFVESYGDNIFFIPPYSPQLNPIKLLSSKWKSVIKVKHEYPRWQYSLIDHLCSLKSDLGNKLRRMNPGMYTFCLKSATKTMFFS